MTPSSSPNLDKLRNIVQKFGSHSFTTSQVATDYLQGDTYYKIKHACHNLDRCRTQFALVRSIEAQQEAIITTLAA